MNDPMVVGVDIGGTKVAAGLVDSNGKIRTQLRVPMVPTGEAPEGLAAVVSAIDRVFESDAALRSSIRGIGICSPGPLDPHTGVVLNPPNLPCWRNFPLAHEIERFYQLPVAIENDANAAALAEAIWGAGQSYRNIFYAGIGTGIGTGIVFDKRIYNGRTGAAAEGGHMSIDYRGPRCGCGKPGCIEVFASGPAIARRARVMLGTPQGRSSAIFEMVQGNIEAVTSEMVGAAFGASDALSVQLLRETIDLLSLWLSNVVDLLEPDAVIIAGGVAQMLSPLFDELALSMAKYCIIPRSSEIPILMAHYGVDSGIAGGAALCSGFLSDASPGIS
jgi:glucokinase